MKLIAATWGTLALTVSGCSDQPSNDPLVAASPLPLSEVPAPAAIETVAYAPPTPPSSNYADEQSGTYSYVSAVSEEDRKRGRAVGTVTNFRYLGRNAEGEHITASIASNGSVSYYSRCADKCVIIRHSDGDQTPYNPRSIIGAVFEDVIRGRLKKWTPPPLPVSLQPTYHDEAPAVSPSAEEDVAVPAPEVIPAMPDANELLTVVDGATR